jgi:hypothetical protein
MSGLFFVWPLSRSKNGFHLLKQTELNLPGGFDVDARPKLLLPIPSRGARWMPYTSSAATFLRDRYAARITDSSIIVITLIKF